VEGSGPDFGCLGEQPAEGLSQLLARLMGTTRG